MTQKIALVFLCAVIIYLANTGQYFGVFLNQFFPCAQNPENAFPCFARIDMGIIIAALLVAAYATGRMVAQMFKSSANAS